MTLARNIRTFERLKKIILKGQYIQEEMVMDIEVFVQMGTLTEEEYNELMNMIAANPVVMPLMEMGFDETGELVSDNIYLLLKKQIEKSVYQVEVIEQMVTDFKITGAINRWQFDDLLQDLQNTYYPSFNENDAVTLPE